MTSLQSADKSDTNSDVFNPEFITLNSQLQRARQREQGYYLPGQKNDTCLVCFQKGRLTLRANLQIITNDHNNVFLMKHSEESYTSELFSLS